jgi:hypothetical protein
MRDHVFHPETIKTTAHWGIWASLSPLNELSFETDRKTKQ